MLGAFFMCFASQNSIPGFAILRFAAVTLRYIAVQLQRTNKQSETCIVEKKVPRDCKSRYAVAQKFRRIVNSMLLLRNFRVAV
jgi:hypothetical protein